MDWYDVCGSPSLIVWSNGNFGQCFAQLVLDFPSSLILAIVSSYYVGKEYNWVVRNSWQRAVLTTRAFICLALACIPLAVLTLKCYNEESLFLADFILPFISSFAWLSHAVFVNILKQRVSRSLRGPLPSLAAWLLTVIPCAFQLRRLVQDYQPDHLLDSTFWLDISYAALLALYLITLIPDGVQPLMVKGSRRQLNSPDDLFDLPRKTSPQVVAPEFERQVLETGSLVRSLHRCFGASFYALGLVKFLGDSLGFVGPLVLAALVQFIDDKTEPMLFGYLCAAALCLASFTAALCNVHFDFKVGEIGLRMRIALVSMIYRKTLSVSSADLSRFK